MKNVINFIKDNSYTIVKCMLNQIGITVFGLMLVMAINQNTPLQVVVGIFSMGFYLFLIYSTMWTIGTKEKDKVDNKRMPYIPLKGAYISLLANMINIILGLCMFISYYTEAYAFYDIVHLVNRLLLQGMYLGISTAIPTNYYPIMYLLTPLPAILTCGIAYYLGVKDKRILKFFGIDTTKSKKNNNL